MILSWIFRIFGDNFRAHKRPHPSISAAEHFRCKALRWPTMGPVVEVLESQILEGQYSEEVERLKREA